MFAHDVGTSRFLPGEDLTPPVHELPCSYLDHDLALRMPNMSDEDLSVFYRCGADGSEWVGKLAPVGPRLGFVSFESTARGRQDVPVNQAFRMRQKLQNRKSPVMPLPPPLSEELIVRPTARTIGDSDITDFGFTCPSCSVTRLLVCPVCTRISCQGLRDSADRIFCQWCGSTLVFGSPSEDSGQRPAIRVEVTRDGVETRARELGPGK